MAHLQLEQLTLRCKGMRRGATSLTDGCRLCRLRFVDLHLITGAIMPVLPTILTAIDVKIGGRWVMLLHAEHCQLATWPSPLPGRWQGLHCMHLHLP